MVQNLSMKNNNRRMVPMSLLLLLGLAVPLLQGCQSSCSSTFIVVVEAFTTSPSPTFKPVGKRNNHGHDLTAATLAAASSSAANTETPVVVDMDDVGFVVLAGGTGSRMKANMRTYKGKNERNLSRKPSNYAGYYTFLPLH